MLFTWLLRPWVRCHDATHDNILVIEPGHLGDVLLLTPALTALREALPAAKITLLVGPWSRHLVERHPALDALLECPFPGFVRGEVTSFWEPYRRLWRFMLLLRAAQFDTAIVARDDHWWGGLLALGAGIPQRVGMAHSLVKPTLTLAVAYNPTEHVTQQRLALVQQLVPGLISKPRLWYEPTEAEQAWANNWLVVNPHVLPLVIVQPGSGGAAKLWLPKRWAQVAAALQDRYALIIAGGPADADHIEQICEALDSQQIRYTPLVGAASLGELAGLFRHCTGVIGTDNGPLHLAVAQAVPTIHLFGPGDEQRFGPWGDPMRHQVIREPLWCAPCGVLSHCPRKTNPSECMTLIKADDVVHVFNTQHHTASATPKAQT